VNCGAKQTESLLRLAYKTMINPDRAITGGSFETMTVVIPDKCMFNAQEPSACEWYFTGLGFWGRQFAPLQGVNAIQGFTKPGMHRKSFM
jgi:N-methylhydantoinase B